MADETIIYAFEGDSSRLQKATQDAINSLTLYEDTVKNIQATLNSLMSSINEVVDYVRLLSDEMKNMTKMASTASDAFKQVKDASTSYANVMRSASDAQRQNAAAAEENSKKTESGGRSAQTAKNGYIVLVRAIESATSAFNSMKAPAKETSSILNDIGNVVHTATAALKTFIGIDLAATFEKSTTQAMDYIENLNLFNVAMGDMIEQGKSFVSQMQEVYGLDPSNIMTYVGNFNQLASAIEMPAETAAILSTNMTKLATDVASLFNMDVVKVADNLKSGLIGMTRAVTKYGIDIRATTLQQTALSLGITENVRTMSEANREGLRYITMMRQTANLSGDWAKTIESPSNQLRILKEQLTQLARAIGNLFLPTIVKVLPYINGFVMSLREAITAIAEFFGFTQMDFGGTTSTLDKTSGALENIGEEADETAKKIKALKAPFDELNVLQDDSSSQDTNVNADTSELMDPAIVAAINALNVPLEDIKMKANEVRDALLEFFNLDGGTFQKVLQKIKDLINQVITLAKTLKGKMSEALTFNSNGERLLDNVKTLLSGIYDWISKIIQDTQTWAEDLNLGPLVDSFNNLFNALNSLISEIGDGAEEFYRNVILPFSEWTIEVGLPEIINGIADAIKWFSEHPEVGALIVGIVTSITLLIGAIKAFVGIMGIVKTVTPILQGISALAGALGISVGALSIKVVLIVAAIAAVIAIIVLLVTHMDEIKEWLRTNVPHLYALLQNIFNVVKSVFSGIWTSIKGIFNTTVAFIKNSLNNIFSTIKNVFKNILYFIDAVIAGDWKKAFKSLANIIISILNAVIGTVVNGVNFMLGIIESLINGVGKAASVIGDAFGKNWGWRVSMKLNADKLKIPMLASGGVVDRPTQVIVGEGKYQEAVVPLGNSPQVDELLDKFADKVTSKEPTEVYVYIGGEEWDTFTYKSSQRGAAKLGAPILGGKTRA